MNKSLLLPLAISVLALGACSTDNDYDLSNIDTTARIPVNAFSVPLKSATVKLDDMLDLSSTEKIKKINDQYAFVQTGSFNSDGITIKNMNIGSKSIEITDDNVSASANLEGIPSQYDSYTWKDILSHLNIDTNAELISFNVPEKTVKELSIEAPNVDASIISVKKLGVSAKASIVLNFPKLDGIVKNYAITNLKLSLPKGLLDCKTSIGTYDQKTGVWSIPSMTPDANLQLNLSFEFKGIDCNEAGATLSNSTFKLAQTVNATGSVVVKAGNIKDNVTLGEIRKMNKVTYKCAVDFSDIAVNTFTGKIKYTIKDVNEEVSLTDIPEELKKTGTKLELTNPQIYLSVNNPVMQNVEPKVGFSLTPEPANSNGPFSLDLTIPSVERKYFCMSPTQPSSYYKDATDTNYDFTKSEYKKFSNLGKILLSGSTGNEGVPSKIKIVASPTVDQDVEDIVLKNYSGVKGYWAFYAPLQLTSESKIVYTKDFDADNDSFDELTITSATIEADVEKTVPLDLSLTVNINSNDKSAKSMQGKADLKHDAKTVTISLTGGPISKISGLNVKAEIKGTDQTLSPSQEIILKNIKLKVNGYYEKKL